jgi:hypothetical protein
MHAMIWSAVVATLITGGFYLAGASPQTSWIIWLALFGLFSFNMARAEIGELKLILDKEAPGWRERNARWTSTWDWNRQIKRKLKREAKAR